MLNAARMRSSFSERRELARKPKWRMRRKPFGQDVGEKASHELVGVQRHRLGLVLSAIILPAKGDAAVSAIEQAAVGDGDAMGVATEIVEDL